MKAYSRLNPFTSETNVKEIYPGQNIYQILNVLEIPVAMWTHARVYVSGHEVLPHNWSCVKPKEKSEIRVYVTPQGGSGGGGKNPIVAVVALAAIVATAGSAGFLSPGFTATLGNVGLTVGASAGAAIAVGGAIVGAGLGLGLYALNSFVKPQLPTLPNLSSGGVGTTSRTLSITGSSNQSNPYGVIPRVYGKHKMFPLEVARTYTEVQGEDEYLNMLLSFGYGPLEISDLKIGTNPIDEFEDVEYEFREGSELDADLTLYRNSILQDNYSIAIEAETQVIRTRIDANEAIVEFSFPSGLNVIQKNDGVTRFWQANLRVEYKKVGDLSWTDFDGMSTFWSDRPNFTALARFRVDRDTGSAFKVAYRQVFPSSGEYDIRITRYGQQTSQGYNNSLLPYVPAGEVDSNAIFGEEIFLSSLKTIRYVNPVNKSGISLLALRIRATDQLNGRISQLNAIVESKVKTWDGSSLTGYVKTRNPAWHYLDVIIGPASKIPVELSRIDLDSIYDWANDNDELDQNGIPKYQFDAVIDYETTQYEIMSQIAGSSRAGFSIKSGKFSIVRDIQQSIVRDIYTPRNSLGFKGYKTFIDTPHAIRARFVSPQKDYEQDEIIVYDDGYNEGNATVFQNLDFFGVTSQEQVWRESRYHLAVGRLRPETYEVNVSVDGFVVERGDLVEVAHDVPLLGGTPTLISNVIDDGVNITDIVLDDFVFMELGNSYGLRVRDLDGVVTTYPINTIAGETKTVNLTNPFPIANAPKSVSLAVFGQFSQESIKCIVSSIERGEDLTAKLTLLPYAENVFTADTGAIPAYDPQINFNENTTPPGVVGGLSATLSRRSAPNYLTDVNLSWDKPSQAQTVSYEVYRSLSNFDDNYKLIGKTDVSNYVYQNATIGNVERFAVLAVSPSGLKLPLSQASSLSVNIPPQDVPDVDTFDINLIEGNISLNWSVSDDLYVSSYQIRHTSLTQDATWEGSIPLVTVAAPSKSVTLPAQVGTYLIKAFDYLGNESENALLSINNISRLAELNIVQTIQEEPTFNGVKENVTVLNDKLRLASASSNFDGISDVDNIVDFDTLDGGGDFDSVASVDSLLNFDSIDTEFEMEGTYYFDNSVDLGEVFTSRVTASVSAFGFDINETVDSWLDVDSRLTWDGTVPSQYNVTLQIRTTNDDPLSSPVWSSWKDFIVSDYTARAFEFRVLLNSLQTGVTPEIDKLQVTIDMPDRTEGQIDIQSGTSTKTITYSAAFRTRPTLQITPSSLSTGDYFELTNQSVSGFDIAFKDSLGTIIDRQFDWLAVGYGRVQ